ncbi:hypothetical protein Q7P36_003607 [Cladosporium allicinum]
MMTNKFDVIDQLQSFVATGDAECQAALTEMDRVKLERRDLLRVLRRAARVAIKQEWGKEAEKAQSNLESEEAEGVLNLCIGEITHCVVGVWISALWRSRTDGADG